MVNELTLKEIREALDRIEKLPTTTREDNLCAVEYDALGVPVKIRLKPFAVNILNKIIDQSKKAKPGDIIDFYGVKVVVSK